MNLYNQHYLMILLILPFLVYGLIKWHKRIQYRFSRFAESKFFPYYYAGRSPFFSTLKIVLMIIALFFVIIALVRPQWDYESRDFEASGLDIVIAIDVSKSMDATDMSPTRLIRAKMQISAFLDKLSTDRVALVAFAGNATIECPLTDDYESVKMILNSLTTDTISRYGTDIGAALEKSAEAFMNSGGSRIIILISDGEDLQQSAISRASQLRSTGLVIYAMGVGSEEGTEIRHPVLGTKAITRLDVETLKKIAAAGGGEFYTVTPGQIEIRYLLERIYSTEKGHLYSKNLNTMKEQYHIFAILSLIILVFESFLFGVINRKADRDAVVSSLSGDMGDRLK